MMGPSGCGKSTLLRCINFLEMFDSGRISIGDLSVSWKEGEASTLDAENDEVPSATCGFKPEWFSRVSICSLTSRRLENVTLAPMQVKGMECREAAAWGKPFWSASVFRARRISIRPRLSGGQQQRVAIARSLAMQPKIMLYDEPTSQLDPRLVDEVFNVMRELINEKMTQIVVTHHEQFARESAAGPTFDNGTFSWTS